jgi:DNA-binding beta-propeller fold protein YncE
VAVDNEGNIYVSDSGNDRIEKFSPHGAWLATWGGRDQFRSPQGLAVDATGDIFVADSGNNRIEELLPTGSIHEIWGNGEPVPDLYLSHPQAIALDPRGNMYVADDGSACLHELRLTSEPLTLQPRQFEPAHNCSPTGIAVAPGGKIVVSQNLGAALTEYAAQTHQPLTWQPHGVSIRAVGGVAISPSGAIFMTDSRANQVLELGPSGGLESRWGRPPASAGFDSPDAVALDPKEDIYVADTGHGRVVVLSADGAPIAQLGFQKVGIPQSLATDSARDLYVLDAEHGRVLRFSSTGRLLASWGGFGTSAGRFLTPEGIAVDTSGHVYVTDDATGTIQKFGPDGTFISVWMVASPGMREGIGSIAFDRAGYAYVAVSGDASILRISPAGRTLAKWGSPGSAPGQFGGLLSLAVDARGDVYVTDNGNRRVQEFSPDGALLAIEGGRFQSPAGIAVDSKSNVFVTDSNANRIYKLVSRRR